MYRCPICDQPVTAVSAEPSRAHVDDGGWLVYDEVTKTWQPCGCIRVDRQRSPSVTETGGRAGEISGCGDPETAGVSRLAR